MPNLPHFPEGSLALACELKKLNIPVKIIDLRLVNKDLISIENPLFFGFTIYSNDSIKYALDFAKKLKSSFPDVPFIWGGPHVHMVSDQTAEHRLVDLACYGEGEITIREFSKQLIESRKDFHKIPGVVFKENGQIYKTESFAYDNLDDLNFYPYEILDLSLYKTKMQTNFYYQTSRGCIHKCRFCNYNYQFKWRGKSSDKVVGEITRIIEQFNPYELYISDGNFFADKRRVVEIITKIKESKIKKFRWSAFCRFDDLSTFSDETMKLMKDAGCVKLNLGGESGSDKILKYLNKGITSEQIVKGIEKCNRYGIVADVSFIAGTPQETDEDLNKTINLILKIQRMHNDNMVNGLFYYQPYPNTPLMEEISRVYNIPLPKDLEEWGKKPITSPYREYLPWVSDKIYSKIFSLTQVINFLYMRKRLEICLRNNILDKKYKLLYSLSGILLPFVKLRLIGKNFTYPIEWKLYYLLKKKIINLDV
jgi:radical SAM superfamily enzyme YgiQ (UPF0313 family)